MFPFVDTPEVMAAQTTTADAMGKSFLFDFAKGDFVLENGCVVQTDDITVWIEKKLRSEKGRSKIYEDTTYEVTLEDLVIGTNYPVAFTESELRREVEDALLQHPRITGIKGFTVTRQAGGGTLVEMEVVTIDETKHFNTVVGANIG